MLRSWKSQNRLDLAGSLGAEHLQFIRGCDEMVGQRIERWNLSGSNDSVGAQLLHVLHRYFLIAAGKTGEQKPLNAEIQLLCIPRLVMS